MLSHLFIKNIAVIDELRIDFQKGLHVFSGETGAGKSILVEAIGLILGERASSVLIRDGANEAVVEAVFSTKEMPLVKDLLNGQALTNTDNTDELIIRRTVSRDGGSKIFINGQRSTVNFLQTLSAHLIDFTGQHDQTILMDSSHDIEVLDAFVDPTFIKNYAASYETTKKLHDQIEQIKTEQASKAQRLEWLSFKLKDFEKLTIKTEEEESELRQQRAFIKNQTVLQEFETLCSHRLVDGPTSCTGNIRTVIDYINKNTCLLDSYADIVKALNNVSVQIDDLAYEITKSFSKRGGLYSLTLDEIEGQLYAIEQLKRKYGPDFKDVLKNWNDMIEEKVRLENSDDTLTELQRNFESLLKDLGQRASELSKARHDVKGLLEKQIKKELSFLKMGGVEFEVTVIKTVIPDSIGDPHFGSRLKGRDDTVFTPHGIDQVTFMLSPNPGLALRPLSKIASGGETSRIFLAIKQVLSQKQKGGTFIFDEIDTGVSGAAVELIGNRLKNLGKKFQVLCVTHHAQIAAQADCHFLVEKIVVQNKTSTRVQPLLKNDRVTEVARLLGGVKITDKTLAHAMEMLYRP